MEETLLYITHLSCLTCTEFKNLQFEHLWVKHTIFHNYSGRGNKTLMEEIYTKAQVLTDTPTHYHL